MLQSMASLPFPLLSQERTSVVVYRGRRRLGFRWLWMPETDSRNKLVEKATMAAYVVSTAMDPVGKHRRTL